jgi:hypothetical protein
MEAPSGGHASGREGAQHKPAPSQDQRAHAPWLSRAGTRASIAWLRLSGCGSGDCAGACLSRCQRWRFVRTRVMVLVLTRVCVLCSIAATTFLTSLGSRCDTHPLCAALPQCSLPDVRDGDDPRNPLTPRLASDPSQPTRAVGRPERGGQSAGW